MNGRIRIRHRRHFGTISGTPAAKLRRVARLFALALLVSGCSAQLNNSPAGTQTNTSIVATPDVADGLTPSQVTITLVDDSGHALVGATPSFTATDTGATNVYGPCTTTGADGISTCVMYSTVAETKQLAITAPIQFVGSTVTFVPAPVSQVFIRTQPDANAIAGASMTRQPVLEIHDPQDNLVTTVVKPISLTAYQDPACTVPGTGTLGASANPVNTVNGVATFSGLTYTKAGPLYLKASSPGLRSNCTDVTTVVHNVAYKLAFRTQPSGSAIAGLAYPTQPLIETQDFWGNLVNDGSTSTPAITLDAWGDPGCSVAVTGAFGATANPVAANAGVATFAGVNHTRATGIYLRASAPGLLSKCSTGTLVAPNAADPTNSSITGSGPVAANSYHYSVVAITIQDQYGNPRPGDAVSFLATDSGSNNVYGGCSNTGPTGIAQCTLRSSTPEVKTLTIQSPTVKSGGTVTFIIPPLAANSSITATGPVPANDTPDSTVTVTLRDASNQPVVGLTPIFQATDTGSTNHYGACTATDPSGVSTCSMSSRKAEVKTLSLTMPLIMTGSNVTFIHGNPAQLVYQNYPVNGTAGQAFGTQPKVLVYDQFMNFVNSGAGASLQILLSPFTDPSCATPGGGALGTSANPLSATGGVASFSGVNYTKAETLYIRASGSGVTSACTPAIPVVNAGPHHYAFVTQPSSTATAGAAFAQQPRVQVQDVYNNPVTVGTGNAYVINLTPFDSSCASPATGGFGASQDPVTASSGTASFAGVNYQKAETITLQASGNSLPTLCSSAIAVSPAAASASTIVGTGPVTADNVASSSITITLKDPYNNYYVGVTPTFSASGASNTYGACSASTASGVSTCTLKSTQAATKTLSLLTPYALSGGTVTFVAGPAAKLAYTTAPPGSVVAGATFGQTPVVQVQDQYANPINGSTAAISLAPFASADCAATPGATSLGGSAGPTAANGTTGSAAFLNLTYTTAGSLYLRATAGGLAAACSGAVAVGPAAANSGNSSISASGPVIADGASASTVSITLKDVYGNALAGTVPAFSAGGSSNRLGACSAVSAAGASSCSLKSMRAETKAIALTSPIALAGGTVTFNPGAASKLVFITQPAASATAGAALAQQPIVQVQDAYANPLPNSTASITLSAATDSLCSSAGTGMLAVTANPVAADGVSGSATFGGVSYTKSGSLYLKAATGGVTGCSSLVTVSPAAPAQLAYSVQPSTLGYVGKTVATAPTVRVLDAYANFVPTATNAVTLAPFTDGTCGSAASGTISLAANPVNASGGSAAFSSLSYSGEGNVYLKASSGGLAPACSNAMGIQRWGQIASRGLGESYSTVWTGTEAITWGGRWNTSYYNVGAAYDPAADTWTALPTTGAPSARAEHTAVWTGAEMIVFGGVDSTGAALGDGARYNPTTNVWTALPSTGAPSPRTRHTAVWTGSQMIVFGGVASGAYLGDGAIYTLASNTWAPLQSSGAPTSRAEHTAVWNGTDMIVFGGRNGVARLGDGGHFNPAGSGSWTPLVAAGLPSARSGHTALWTGTEMLLWGGTDGSTPLDTGARYLGTGSPPTWSWTDMSATGAPGGRSGHVAVWTGSTMIVWGGTNGSPLDTGGVYTPGASGTPGGWSATSVGAGLPTAEFKNGAVWWNDRMLLFGGCTTGATPCNSIYLYGFFYLP